MHQLDRRRQAQVGIGDHQPGASEAKLYCFAEASGYERAQKLTPEGIGFAVAHGNAQNLPKAESIDTDGDHHRP